MSKTNLILLPFYVESHVISSFSLAHLLEDKHNVHYIVSERYVSVVEAQGYEAHAANGCPFGRGFERYNRKLEGSEDLYLDTLTDRFSDRLYHDRAGKLLRVCNLLNPKWVFIDMMNSTDFILLYPYLAAKNVKVAFFQPTLSTYRRSNVPPLHSNTIAGSSWRNATEWWKFILKRKAASLRDFVIYLGRNDYTIRRRWFKRNNLPTNFGMDGNDHYNVAFKNIPELILAPEELEFQPNRKLPYQHYTGGLINVARKQTDADPRCDEVVLRLADMRRSQGIKVIYCAFGTMHEDYLGQVQSFLQRLLQVIVDLGPEIHLVGSVNPTIINAIDLGEYSTQIHLFAKVPQLSVLSICDLFVNHGGLGSIKEGIHFEVPMLVFPLAPVWDPQGNAARVAYHEIGLRGHMTKDSYEDILGKVVRLLTNPVYKENIKKINKRIRDRYTKESFLNLFEDLTANHPMSSLVGDSNCVSYQSYA